MWDVVLIDASLPSTDPDGDAWDAFGGLPDPFVHLYAFAYPSGGVIRTAHADSEVIDDTLVPDWGDAVLASEIDRRVFYHLRLTVNDADLAYNDPIGDCIYSLDETNPSEVEEIFSGAIQVCRTDRDMVLRWRMVPHTP
jgi:hypothetical protein